MIAVILAGGLGTRLSEETELKPKPLVEIGTRPIIWHIMKNLSAQGIRNFIILAGYKSVMIKKYFLDYYVQNADVKVLLSDNKVSFLQSTVEDWDVSVIDTGLKTMTGGRLKRIAHMLPENEPFLFTYGDGLADINLNSLVQSHVDSKKLATVTGVFPPARFGALEIDKYGTVTSFTEKPKNEIGRINGGFFILRKKCLEYIYGDDCVWEEGPMQRLVEERQLSVYLHDTFWQPMDTLREKRALEELWQNNAPWRNW